MPHKDKEKQRAAWKKYNRSPKGIKRTQDYLARHESELRKRRKEKQQKRFEAFCWRHNVHPDIIRRLISFQKTGKNIDFDLKNARILRLWQQGEREKKEEQASVGTVDFY